MNIVIVMQAESVRQGQEDKWPSAAAQKASFQDAWARRNSELIHPFRHKVKSIPKVS